MSQNHLQAVINRAASDPAFLALLSADPTKALDGYALTPAETQQLKDQYAGSSSGAPTNLGLTGGPHPEGRSITG